MPIHISPQFTHLYLPGFLPGALYQKIFQQQVHQLPYAEPLIFGLERPDQSFSRYETTIFPSLEDRTEDNYLYAERILKFLLWKTGGAKVYIGGPSWLGEALQQTYSPNGARSFDAIFMGQSVYQQTFTVIPCHPQEVPPPNEKAIHLGRNLKGCRIGFDLGASDLKVSAVQDGTPIFSQEIAWEPRAHSDPEYHYQTILSSIQKAATFLPRVDAIGGSSAGVIINNRPMIASLFRAIPAEKYHGVHTLFLKLQKQLGVPVEVVNDGEVTALAGSMALGVTNILGLALGSSLAAGYITPQGRITNWLNELAFAPIDYSLNAPVDEWSNDHGIASQYLSQQCVFRLASLAGIEIPPTLIPVDRLRFIQDILEQGNKQVASIWQAMGIALGYAIAQFHHFYNMEHILVLGRCTSGIGGKLLVDTAHDVLQEEFPQTMQNIQIHLPDEKTRRVGQSIAAASLPTINGGEE